MLAAVSLLACIKFQKTFRDDVSRIVLELLNNEADGAFSHSTEYYFSNECDKEKNTFTDSDKMLTTFWSG